MNPYSPNLVEGLNEALDGLGNDDDIKVVIIRGAGRAFCAGADLNEVYRMYGGAPGGRRPSERIRMQIDRRISSELQRRVFLFPKITIAQIHGYCIGMGALLAYCCDFLIADEDALIGHTEQRLGFSGTSMLFAILVSRVGLTRAIDLLIPGKLISGKEAQSIGLVTLAVPHGRLEKVVRTRAREIATLPRDGIAIGKAMRQIEYGNLGILSSFDTCYVGHSFWTNLRWEEDEFNFIRERQKVGVQAAIKARDALWQGTSLRSDAIAKGEIEE
jgi:enoyl-CoA hydratase